MPVGATGFIPPIQPSHEDQVIPDSSYFQVKLCSAQAYFDLAWMRRAAYLALSSTVTTSLRPDTPIQSLRNCISIKKGVPSSLGRSYLLTDWLPAESGSHLAVKIDFTVVQDTPFKKLVDQMESLQLASAASVVDPKLFIAVEVSKLAGRLLSYFAEEGSAREVFSIEDTLSVVDLNNRYYVGYGSSAETSWPNQFRIDENGRLTDKNGHLDPLGQLSYAVLQVYALPRHSPDYIQRQPWWQLLEAAREEALEAKSADLAARNDALERWTKALQRVKQWAHRDGGLLVKDLDGIVAKEMQAVKTELQPDVIPESHSTTGEDTPLMPALRDVLGVDTEEALSQAVRDYQDALEVSQRLLAQYDLDEG